MSKTTAALKPVSAARVREAYRAGLFKAPDAALPSLVGAKTKGVVRGRLNPLAVEAFNKAMKAKGEVYGGEKSGITASKTVEVPMFSAKTGRPVKPITKTLDEVRAAAGITGKKGRISKADLHRAALAFGSGEPKVKAATPAKPKTTGPKASPVTMAKATDATPTK